MAPSSLIATTISARSSILVISAAQPTQVLIGEDGFWDVGAERAAIPAAMLRWHPEREAPFATVSIETLQDAPAYMADAGWNPEENDRFYKERSN